MHIFPPQEGGAQDKPVLLKRGMSATIEEWLMAAEYIMAAGNPNVISVSEVSARLINAMLAIRWTCQ